jgi:DNA-binding LacI/PurR family transcriptional regulator
MRPAKPFVSAQRVAERAGVSRSAVSRTFTPGASVSADTRRRVLLAAEELGYHVNHLARGLMRRETGIVCLVVADVDTPFLSRLTNTLTRRLQDAGKVAMILNTSGPSANVDVALRQTIHYRADATIVLSGTPDPSILRLCLDNGQRLVAINRDDRLVGPRTIALDNAAAAKLALTIFLKAGRRRLLAVTSEAGTPSLLQRENGFLTAARELGLEARVVRRGRTGYACGATIAREVLARPDAPDAAFCVTDLIACGFMDAARTEFGLDIPRDLCVVGFDDIEQAGWSSYDLTTFAQPVDRIVDAALQALSDDGPGEPTRIVLSAALIWRGSARPSQTPVR